MLTTEKQALPKQTLIIKMHTVTSSKVRRIFIKCWNWKNTCNREKKQTLINIIIN